ncbi:MAG: HAMP domain-containing histidine kinase [Cyanothece sp. SIO1E1]|nr:HAMP domain-containing histidine kinase [Cyanothece sp. SIO1E1]
MAKIDLRARLFLSHIIVMIVGLVTLASFGKIYSPRLFVVYLERIEGRGFSVRQVRTQLMQGFESAWSRGMLLSLLVGGTAAGGLSYLVTQRIVRPLLQMEQITQKLAAGQLNERVPTSEIPELSRLAASFNRMAADLEGVEQRRRELVGDLTHELRTPLTIVGGYLEGLADETITPSADVYQRLTQETTRLRRLVNDLQELSKMEAGYLPINIQPVQLQPLLTALVQRFADQLPEAGNLNLSLECATDLPIVMADPERVEQILVNLLSNALQYTAAGSITVRAWPQSNQLWISVTDTGQGIAPQDLAHVFERFWRADRSRDRHSGGTGIGLAICRRLIELQGGTITVTSQLNQGSTFQFNLPLA